MPHPNSPKRSGKKAQKNRRFQKESGTKQKNTRKRQEFSRADGDSLHLFGVHTVRAALENPKRKKTVLYATENALPKVQDVLENDLPDLRVETRTAPALDQLVGADAVHQGLVLECAPLDALDASELFHLADAELIVVLDQITDPHNAGAILRSACALGADAVITTNRNTVRETAVLAKSASGALDHVKLIQLKNLSKGLAELNEMGFFSFGLDSLGPLVVEETLKQANPSKIALVLGAENKGLREKTRETCSALARLDMPGPIKSLNVSNAAILSLYIAKSHLRNLSR